MSILRSDSIDSSGRKQVSVPFVAGELESLQAGDLVRVHTKSGFIEGRLVSAKGDDVLVETSDGMRITLDGSKVERLGDSETRVVLP